MSTVSLNVCEETPWYFHIALVLFRERPTGGFAVLSGSNGGVALESRNVLLTLGPAETSESPFKGTRVLDNIRNQEQLIRSSSSVTGCQSSHLLGTKAFRQSHSPSPLGFTENLSDIEKSL